MFAAALAALALAQSGWTFSTEKDEMTDKLHPQASAVSADGRAKLVYSCPDKPGGKPTILFMSNDFIGGGPRKFRPVQYRVDASVAVEEIWFHGDTSVLAVNHREPSALSDAIRHGQTLLLRISNHRDKQEDYRFSLVNVADATAAVDKACRPSPV
jgi:hypothetical protein